MSKQNDEESKSAWLKAERQPSVMPQYDYIPLSPYITVPTGGGKGKHIPLPNYGEVKIITHAGKVTFIETSVKEKGE